MRKKFITLIICGALTGTGLMGGTIKSGMEWINPLRAILGIESVNTDKTSNTVEKTIVAEDSSTKEKTINEEMNREEVINKDVANGNKANKVVELVASGQSNNDKNCNEVNFLDNEITGQANFNEASKDNNFSVELLKSNRTSRVSRPNVSVKPSVTPTPTPSPNPKPATTPAPAVTPVPVKPSTGVVTTEANFEAKVEQLIFNRVNAERAKAGMSQLSYNSSMEKYARIKSKDMGDRGYFDHKNPEGQLITAQMAKDGVSYRAWGENIAYIGGTSDLNALADKFMTNWMNSAGHRANILSSNFTSIGVGVYKSGNRYYATQEFYK